MPRTERDIFWGVALMSCASMGYELLLLRFFSIMYWDHFAHLIIGMALLGFGVSGTILALAQHRMLSEFYRWFNLGALLFVLSLLFATSMAGRIGFNPPEVIWAPGQLARLTGVFLLATLPFFCAGLCIGLTMRWRTEAVERIYQADLTGASCGALLIMVVLFYLRPQEGVRVLALIGLLASLVVGSSRKRRTGQITSIIFVLTIIIWPSRWLAPAMSPFKGMPQTLQIPGVHIVAEENSPTGIFTVLASPSIPFRFAPGLSMLAPTIPPDQLALYHDGHPAGIIQKADNFKALAFLRWTPMALPYVLLEHPRVLVLGAGGGGDVWHALIETSTRVDAVETHQEFIDFVMNRFNTYTGNIYSRDTVHLHQVDARGFLAAATASYDLIQISPLGTAIPPTTGGHALETQYLFTVEGMQLALSRLSKRGILAVSLTHDLPPRSAVKMMATIVCALKQLKGGGAPFSRIAVIRAYNTVTIIASRAPLSQEQNRAIRAFCHTRAFDLAWLPDISAAEVNQVNVLDRPFLYEAALDLRKGRKSSWFKLFKLTPATDDRPWFNHFFRWSSFRTFWEQRTTGAAAMLEWEYLLLWISLGVALTFSLLMIVVPLRPLYNIRDREERRVKGNLVRAIYFAALGLAFIFLEIAFIQHFILFLSHPMIAMAVIVPSFLFFAGFGSGTARQVSEHLAASRLSWIRNRPVLLAVTGIITVSSVYLWLLPQIFAAGIVWPVVLRILVSIPLIGGLAFWMGMPFPLGLKQVGENHHDFVPLAWGVNGFFSVISAISATIIALHGGFRVVIVLALALYLLAAALERRL